jgi:ATPase subunit of ABC transporter with duplicated ATPase domains
VLFKNATLSLAHGRKYGLIAPNGSGKSTLLNYISQRTNEFISIPKHFDIHYVEQEVNIYFSFFFLFVLALFFFAFFLKLFVLEFFPVYCYE